jgi:hypothetical protein
MTGKKIYYGNVGYYDQKLSWNRYLLEKLLVDQLVKSFPALHVTRFFINTFSKLQNGLELVPTALQKVHPISLSPLQQPTR